MGFYKCLLVNCSNDLAGAVVAAKSNSFDCVAVNISNIQLPDDPTKEILSSTQISFLYPPLLLNRHNFKTRVIFIHSPLIDCDSPNREVVKNSERLLKDEISFANHMQNSGYTMIRLTRDNNYNLARNIAYNIKGLLLVQIPAYNESAKWRHDVPIGDGVRTIKTDNWHRWNKFRLAADSNKKLKVVLELSECYPLSLESVRRWLGEPVEAIIVHTNMFARVGKKTILSKQWEEIIGLFMGSHVNVMLDMGFEENSKLYAQYIAELRLKYRDKHIMKSYEEAMEIALQPLADNLDCYTYEIFETDPVKYKAYQKAVVEALTDRVSDKEKHKKVTVVMVLGAGRGPLVRATLNASKITERKVKVYIIEKNPNAIRSLQAISKKMWGNDDVTLICTDMREFKPKELGDILVSELLGSFGDNELSPECLESAVELLKPDGISIPCNSTSFINPIMSMKLYNEMRETSQFKHEYDIKDFFESAFVSLQKNVYHIDHSQAAFTFVHPNRAPEIDNERSVILRFKATDDCLMHGFAGYFESVLYKDILLSINLKTHTPGMFSWFPMYFPLTHPINIKKGDTIEVNFHRCVSKLKVWYTWQVSEPVVTHIYNQDGKSYFIRIFT